MVVTYSLAIAIGSIGGALVSGLITYLLQNKHESQKLRREGYGEAIAALYAWYEYPFQIRRRVSDSQETLDRLVQLGNENQQRIARSLAWMAIDSNDAYVHYHELVKQVKAITAEYIKEAWKLPPTRNSIDLNLGSWIPETIDDKAKEFLDHISPAKFNADRYIIIKDRRDNRRDSMDAEVEDIKSSRDKYITWSDMHRMINDRFIGNISGFFCAGIFGGYILINNRYTDPNSMEGESALLLWGMTVTLMSSHMLVIAFEFLSRRSFKYIKIPFFKGLNIRNIMYGAIISFLSLFIPLILFLWFVAIVN